jgi:hypothetical protein
MKRAKKALPVIICAALIAGAGITAGLVFAVSRNAGEELFWYVSPEIQRAWTDVMAENPMGGTNTIRAYLQDEGISGEFPGFIITYDRAAAARMISGEEGGGEGGPVMIYQNLSVTQDYNGAVPLAVDPWMVFREYVNPALTWSLAASGAGGALLIPGFDGEYVSAWLAQLLQEEPGVFPQDEAVWDAAREVFFLNPGFQRGAVSYNWNDVWILFQKTNPAWIYAPLSRIRGLPRTETAGLEASRFPSRPDWRNYGIQAKILWAVPSGKDPDSKKLSAAFAAAEDWLKDARVQTKLAEVLLCAPAVNSGLPFNAISQSAQFAWLNSSFVWQAPKR